MKVTGKIEELRRALKPVRIAEKSVGFVPTMGALHEGHLSLIRRAREDTDFVVVSIFVNPTQFCPGEDYNQYPRPIEADLRLCEKEEVDLVFNPEIDEMYPRDQLTVVSVKKLTENLCGRFRPGHFDGVTTVVTKLFNIVQPDVAYFGQKDAQQAIVIKRMVEDLNFPIKIVVCPTVREKDGLALSSRNQYLTPDQRKQANSLYQALLFAKERVEAGETNPETVINGMRKIIESAGPCRIDYISIVDLDKLEDVREIKLPVLIALAVHIGKARLIDNIIIGQKEL